MSPLAVTCAVGVLVALGSLLSAPAQVSPEGSAPPEVEGESLSSGCDIGYVDIRQLHARATMYGEGIERINQREAELEYQRQVEKSWIFLEGAKARRGVELELLGNRRTAAETSELNALRDDHTEAELEFESLKDKADATTEELRRLRELFNVVQRREEQIQISEADMRAALAELRGDVQQRWVGSLAKSLMPTAEKHSLDIVLSSHVPTWQFTADGGPPSLVWENVVLYGGVDVTDDVVATMNSGGPPPAPVGGNFRGGPNGG